MLLCGGLLTTLLWLTGRNEHSNTERSSVQDVKGFGEESLNQLL
jgi:hypothetical protein